MLFINIKIWKELIAFQLIIGVELNSLKGEIINVNKAIWQVSESVFVNNKW